MAAWVYPAIMAGASILGSLFDQGDGGSSGSQTTQQSPGTFTDMPGGQDVWDQAFGMISGGSQSSGGYSADPETYRQKQMALASNLQANDKKRFALLGDYDQKIGTLQKIYDAIKSGDISSVQSIVPREYFDQKTGQLLPNALQLAETDLNHMAYGKENAFPELAGMYTVASWGWESPTSRGNQGQTTTQPSLLDMMTEDYNSKVGASDQYLSDMTGVDKTLMDELNGTTDAFQGDLTGYKNTLNTPAFYLNLGGKNVGVVPRGTRENVGLLADLSQSGYNAGVNKANTGYQVGSNAATRNLTQAETYTPNAAQISYLKDTILPLALKLNDTRYGLPSQTETGNLTSTPSFLEKLSNSSNIITPIMQMLQNSFGKNNTGSTDGKTLQELYPGISING